MTAVGPLMIDVAGLSLSAEDKQLIADDWVGGVILFTRNYQSKHQLQALCAEIRACSPKPRVIAVDQEGGRVQRFKEAFATLPALASIIPFAERFQLNAEVIAQDLGWLMASEVIACGVDLSFAPVLDLNKDLSSVIGDRAFGGQIDQVVSLAKAYIMGMTEAGMKSCGKHYPGHGSVAEDSHEALPIDGRTLDAVLAEDARVFAALIDIKIDALMMAHIQFPQIDSLPVGFSEYWIQTVLRKQQQFSGLVVSDDLSMEGAAVVGDFPKRVEQSLLAGCEMLLICNNRPAVCEVLSSLRLPIETYQSEKISQFVANSKPLDTQRLERVHRLCSDIHEFK